MREFFATKFTGYTERHRQEADSFIHRYPVVQCKMIRNFPTVIGINEGALFLKEFADETREILSALTRTGLPNMTFSSGMKSSDFGDDPIL